VMRRDARWKLVYYLGEKHGELYDLVTDPGERSNLWAIPEHTGKRDLMIRDLLEWSVRTAVFSRQQSGAKVKPQQPMRI
jgi:arylsulfatase